MTEPAPSRPCDLDALQADLMRDRRYRRAYRIASIRYWLAWQLHRLGWWLDGADTCDWRCPHCHELLGPEREWYEEEE